jgi:hypothetical protein
VLHSQLDPKINKIKEIPKNSDLFFFSEEKYIEENPSAYDEERLQILREWPTLDSIYEFLKAFYDIA